MASVTQVTEDGEVLIPSGGPWSVAVILTRSVLTSSDKLQFFRGDQRVMWTKWTGFTFIIAKQEFKTSPHISHMFVISEGVNQEDRLI